jgi:hypothetical protein
MYSFRRNRPVVDLPVSQQPSDDNPINDTNPARYSSFPNLTDYLTNSEPRTRSKYKPVFQNDNITIGD